MADEEKKPRRRRRQPKAPQEEQPLSDIEVLAHNASTLGVAQMKLLQAIYAEQRAASFFIISQETDGEESAETFRHAIALQQQGTDLVRGAWYDVRGPAEEEEPKQTDGDSEVSEE